MATNLLEVIEGTLTPAVVSQAGALVGESPGTAQRALEGSAVTLLAGLMRQTGSPDGTSRLLGLLNRYGSSNVLANLPDSLRSVASAQGLMNSGSDILTALFGARLDSVASVIGRSSGAKASSTTTLLTLAAPLVLGALARVRSTQGLDAGGLVRLLGAQRDTIARAAPSGLATALGPGAGPDDEEPLRREAYRPIEPPPATRSMWWAAPLLLLGALGLGLWYAGRRPPFETPLGRVDDATSGVRPGVVEEVAEVKLPNGDVVRLEQRSSLHGLARYLGSNDPAVPKRFIVERMNFETGSARLTADSVRSVDDLGTILRAYPSVQMALEGHADASGDTEANRHLSLARAQAVKSELAARGVDPDRITTTGQGQDRPVASNDDENGRARNRRLEAVVLRR